MSAPRIPFATLQPDAYRALSDLNAALYQSSLGRKLVDLVFLRVSQINGCAYCVDLHWRDLMAQDEDPRRLNSLATWREAPFFDARERAALNWADKVTQIRALHEDDGALASLQEHFDNAEIAALTFAVAAMNAWNRMAVSLHMQVKPA